MASRYIVVEYSLYDSFEDALDTGFTDTYPAGDTLDEAVAKLADVRDTYPNYNHALIENIPVTIESVSTGGGEMAVATDGDVRVTAYRNRV